MTESSFFWDGTITGDAAYAPYSAQRFQRIMRIMFAADWTKSGIVAGVSTYTGALTVTQPNATTLRVNAGEAIVYGTAYIVDQVDLVVTPPSAGYNFYTLVLRCNIGAHTTRAMLLGPSASTFPSPVQNGYYWDIVLRRVQVSTGGIQWVVWPTNEMIAMNHIHMVSNPYRQGGSATAWDTAGTTNRLLARGAKIQCGVAIWTGASGHAGSVSVTFPHAFTYNPIVFVSVAPYTSANYHISHACTFVNTTTCTLVWESAVGENFTAMKLNWMAIGHLTEF